MGRAIEVIGLQVSAPGAGAAMSAVAGNSLTIRDTSKKVGVSVIWQRRQVAGFTRITSPLLHDTTNGIRLVGPAGLTVVMMPDDQVVMPQDDLVVSGSGSAVAGALEQSALLVMYEDLPGVAGRFLSPAAMARRLVDYYAVPVAVAAGTAGGWSGAAAVNSVVDQFRANTDYAIIGATLDASAAALRIVSPDWGNLGVGMPANSADPRFTANFFVRLSASGSPAIPVFNSSNRGQTLVEALQDENGADINVMLLLGRLK